MTIIFERVVSTELRNCQIVLILGKMMLRNSTHTLKSESPSRPSLELLQNKICVKKIIIRKIGIFQIVLILGKMMLRKSAQAQPLKALHGPLWLEQLQIKIYLKKFEFFKLCSFQVK